MHIFVLKRDDVLYSSLSSLRAIITMQFFFLYVTHHDHYRPCSVFLFFLLFFLSVQPVGFRAGKRSETGFGGLTQHWAPLCKTKPGNPSHVLPLTVKEERGAEGGWVTRKLKSTFALRKQWSGRGNGADKIRFAAAAVQRPGAHSACSAQAYLHLHSCAFNDNRRIGRTLQGNTVMSWY